MYIDLELKTEELDRASKLVGNLVAHLRNNRIDYNRARLLRVQNDLSALISRVGEAQRVICMYMTEPRPRPPRAPLASASIPVRYQKLEQIAEKISEDTRDDPRANRPQKSELHLLKGLASNRHGAGALWESLFGLRLRREPRARGLSL